MPTRRVDIAKRPLRPHQLGTTAGRGGQRDGSLSLSDASVLLESRGKQVMDAILAGWPSARVLSPYGPWVSYALLK